MHKNLKICHGGLGLICFTTLLPAPIQNDLDDPERGMIFVCSATHKTKSMFFFLAQTEQGDIFKITLETDEEMVRAVAPDWSLVVMKWDWLLDMSYFPCFFWIVFHQKGRFNLVSVLQHGP